MGYPKEDGSFEHGDYVKLSYDVHYYNLDNRDTNNTAKSGSKGMIVYQDRYLDVIVVEVFDKLGATQGFCFVDSDSIVRVT